MNDEKKPRFRFKSFELDIAERQLLRKGKGVSLTPRAFDVLVALVERHGHLVEKEELLQIVWQGSFVEEANVSRIVYTLRNALGENENGKKYIETIAKKGYRFIAEVTEVEETISEHFKAIASPAEISNPTNAYQAYQLAQYYFQKVTAPDLTKARILLEQAIQFDAAFASAHAKLAEIAVMEVIIGLSTPAQGFRNAKISLWRAAELDLQSTEFYAAAGFVALCCDWNFMEAEKNLRKTIDHNPHHAFANKYLGEALMYQGRLDEAEIYLLRAIEIEPMDFHHRIVWLIYIFFTRNYQKLIEECESLLANYPHLVVAGWMRCWGLDMIGRSAEAITEYEKILLQPGGELAWRWIGHSYALLGQRENALDVAARLEAESREHYLSPTYQSLIYVGLNNKDKAYSYLEKSMGDRDPWILWTAADPRFDNLRSDKRFDYLIKPIFGIM